MRICAISDTHGYHESVKINPSDVIVCAGDITDDAGQGALRRFLQWFEKQPAPHKVLIAGNHDWAFEKWPDLARAMVKEVAPSVQYLQDSGTEIDSIKFWGSPVQPRFLDWAFNRDEDIQRHWDMISEGTDVLVTHGPPKPFLDLSNNWNESTGSKWTDHLGCPRLMEAVKRVRPKLHIFGHIHGSGGEMNYTHEDGFLTKLINASMVDEAYIPNRKPIYYEL